MPSCHDIRTLVAPQSSQLFSTVSRTRLVYSLRFSLYRFDASTLAGDEVFGSFNRLDPVSMCRAAAHQLYRDVPLNTGQDGCHVVRGRPPVLQNVQTQLAGPVYVGMEHLANKLDARRLVWVCLLEMHYKTEGPVFERCVCWADDNCVPVYVSAVKLRHILLPLLCVRKSRVTARLGVACGGMR